MGAAPKIGLAVVGLGYWGPNLLRNAWEVQGARVTALCDLDPRSLELHARRYPSVRTTTSYDDVLADPEVGGVLISTPVGTHHGMARAALEAGKHVFVEKPMAQTTEQCEDLMALADEKSLALMPGHTFL